MGTKSDKILLSREVEIDTIEILNLEQGSPNNQNK